MTSTSRKYTFQPSWAYLRCRNCGAGLETHRERSEEFCRSLRCRPACLAYVANKAKEQEQRATDARDIEAMEVLAELKAKAEVAEQISDDAILMIIPKNEREVVEQSAERISEFRDHLNRIMQGQRATSKTQICTPRFRSSTKNALFMSRLLCPSSTPVQPAEEVVVCKPRATPS